MFVAAAKCPEATRSLTVIEPPACAVAVGAPAVEELLDRLRPVFGDAAGMTEEFDAAFDSARGFEHPPHPLDPPARHVAEAMRRERPPWEAEIPLASLARAPFPKLVVSGGCSAAFDDAFDVLERELAAERAALQEYAGYGVQDAPGFNDLLERCWSTEADAA